MSTRIRRTTTLLVTAAAAAAIGLTIAAPPPAQSGVAACRKTFSTTLGLRSVCTTQNDNSQGDNNNQGEQGTRVAVQRAPA